MERMNLNRKTDDLLREGMGKATSPGSEGDFLDKKLVIAEDVVAALAEDPRTASSVIEVVYERGVITLMGHVKNEAAHAAAEEIAHRHEDVVSVVNALEVRPGPRDVETVVDLYLGNWMYMDLVQ